MPDKDETFRDELEVHLAALQCLRNRALLLSAEEYRRLQELEERAFPISDLTDVELSSLSEVVIPTEAKLYNEEMEEKE